MFAWLFGALIHNFGHAQPEHEAHHPPLEHDPHYGMHPALFAFAFGILSGASLPLGSWLGIVFSPVNDKTCALMMAFGAGALLFAVTVELYGHALHQVAAGNRGSSEFFTIVFGALVGGAFYLTINKWLEEYLVQEEDDEETSSLVEDEPKRLMTCPEILENDSEAGSRSESMAAVANKKCGSTFDSLHTEKRGRAYSEVHRERTSLMQELRKQEQKRERAKTEVWDNGKDVEGKARAMTIMTKNDLQAIRGREKALRALNEPQEDQHAKSVAYALFLGLLVDGVPEGILMGFLSAEGHLTPVLVISLFVANFPEAFSSSSLLTQARIPTANIIGMWGGLTCIVGCLAGLSCWLLLMCFPEFGQGGANSNLPHSVLIGIALVEGITGGAMIACIAAVMLPEAFERAGKEGPFFSQSGFLCLSGFLLSAVLKALFG